MNPRHALSWKPWFYSALLPALRRLDPARADATLASLGRMLLALDPLRRRHLDRQIDLARTALGAGWDRAAVRRDLAAGILRTLARDYPLEGPWPGTAVPLTGPNPPSGTIPTNVDGTPGVPPAEEPSRPDTSGPPRAPAPPDPRFDITGFAPVRDALDRGRGLILLGSHLGAHLAGLHWMARNNLPLRLLVQRPRHVSPTLQSWFDAQSAPGVRLPQADFFLRRDLDPAQAVRRVLLARDALRHGHLVYLNGDVPWPIPSARPARFLGAVRPFLTLWADLAAQTGAAVVPLFATHQPGGRYRLTFDPPFHVAPGSQPDHLAAYLARLESLIAAHPADAVPYLTWPTYTRPQAPAPPPAISATTPAAQPALHAAILAKPTRSSPAQKT